MTKLPESLSADSAATSSDSGASHSPQFHDGVDESSSPPPPTAEELARIQRQEAMLERLMERKLAMLEAEYAQCIDAEAETEPDTEQKNGEVESLGYQRYVHGQPVTRTEGEAESEAWQNFKRDLDSDSDEDAITDVAAVADSEPVAAPTQPLHAPLTAEKISSIKSAMTGIKLRPPPWALGQPEDMWMARILERAGFMRNQQPRSAPAAQSQTTQSHSLTDDGKAEKKRSKKKKKKSKRATKQRASAAAASVSEEFTDFEAEFPAATAAAAASGEESVAASSTSAPLVSDSAAVSAA